MRAGSTLALPSETGAVQVSWKRVPHTLVKHFSLWTLSLRILVYACFLFFLFPVYGNYRVVSVLIMTPYSQVYSA